MTHPHTNCGRVAAAGRRILASAAIAMMWLAVTAPGAGTGDAGNGNWHRGAVDEKGITIDPTTTPEYNAPRVWQPKEAAAGTPTRPYPCRIVSYADKWTRSGLSVYMSWRHPDGPLAQRSGKGLDVLRDFDVDGDGQTADDFVASLPFSLAEPLSNPNWPLHRAFPEIINKRFYGGVSWYLANTDPAVHRSVWIEQGFNPDHSCWPDGRAEDHPLQGQAYERDPKSGLKVFWAILWKKQDFLNGGDKHRVTFDDQSVLASTTQRGYWLGYDDVRMIVMDGDQLYISDNRQFDIPSLRGYGEGRHGRVFRCSPTRATWARYEPSGHLLHFDAERVRFETREFRDVQAVGWYLAKSRLDTGTQAHCKWYGFECDAVVHRPEQGSVNLDMVKVAATQDVPEFWMATCEWPYANWKKVHRWGNAPFYTLQGRYVYDKFAQMGSMVFGEKTHSPDEPATGIKLYDAMAICNTLSEYEGKTPCYYLDPEFKSIFKNQFLYTIGKVDLAWKPKPGEKRVKPEVVYAPRVPPKVYVKWDADGHRLPTAAEWRAAFALGKTAGDADSAVVSANSGGQTHPVGSKKPNALGLYDMAGNVWELVWVYGDVLDPDRHNAQLALGGDFQHPAAPDAAQSSASPYGDDPWEGNGNIGLRIVRRGAGAARPAIGDVPASSGEAGGIAAWVIRKGQKTAARQQPAMTDKPLLDMVKIPGGKFDMAIRDLYVKDIFVSPFEMAKTPTTYAQWKTALQWAKARGYTFSYEGDMGSMYWYLFPHAPDEPVVHITGHDIMAWCNALSEMEGRTPCYYTDEQRTLVYRRAFMERPRRPSGEENIIARPGPWGGINSLVPLYIFVRWDADGYRLPTKAERAFAESEGGKKGPPKDRAEWEKTGWSIFHSGGRTHPVGLKQPGPFGLYDLWGNTNQWLWGTGLWGSGSFDPRRPLELDRRNPKYDSYWDFDSEKHGRCGYGFDTGSSFINERWGFDVSHKFYYPDLGFRVVRCTAGTHPRDGKEPLDSWPTVVQFDRSNFDPLQAGDPKSKGTLWRGNLARTGEHLTAGVAKLRGLKWKFQADGPVFSSPVAFDGLVYVGAEGGHFYAFDAETGKEVWKLAIPGGSRSSACVAGGVAYFCGNDGKLYAADAKTGKLKWSVAAAKGPLTGSPAVAYGMVFLEGPVAFDAATGKKVAGKEAVAGEDRRTGSVGIVNDTMIHNAGVFGIEQWRFLASGDTGFTGTWASEATEVVAHGLLYYPYTATGGANALPDLRVYDAKTGRSRWSRTTAKHSQLAAMREVLLSSPALSGKTVLIGTDHGELLAMDALSGKDLWAFQAGGPIRCGISISAADGVAYFGCHDGCLYAVDPKTGKELWRFKTGGKIESSPWPERGAVYVGSEDGAVYALH